MGTDIHGIFQAKKDGKWVDIKTDYEENRHYLLFAWIGNVRNGFGFAGVPTHTVLTPLSNCRGLPVDFEVVDEIYHPLLSNELRGRRAEYFIEEDSDPTNDDYLRMWMGDHSFSWLLADEVLSAVMPKIKRIGIVDREFYDTWDRISAPESWSGGISGPGIKVSMLGAPITEDTTHVWIEWVEDTEATLAYFVDEVRRLKELHGEVRFVFGFDS